MDNLIFQTLFNFCILLITDCSGYITYFPENAAVKVGGTAVFNCTSSSIVTAWYLSRNGETSGSSNEQITTFCNVSLGYSAHYKTEPLAGYQATCNLIVLDSTLQQAGVYTCSDGLNANQNAFSLMTVVNSPPTITANQSDVEVGKTLRLSCTIGYNGSVSPAPLLPPSIYWTSSTGENISSTLSPSPPPNSVESYILVNPDGSSNFIGPFNCHGYFEEPQNIDPGYATNAPTLSSSTTSLSFQVFERATILYLNGSDCTGNVCYCNSDGSVTLSCNAKGIPMPGYGWSKANDSSCFLSTTNDTITATSNGTYQCTAENEFHGKKYTDSATITVMGCASPETWICDSKFVEETSTCALGLEDWLCGLVLGLIIYLSLNILALVAFLLYYGLSETGHRRLNDRFDNMEKMLPCMNKGRDCSGWVCLFGFLSILAGIVYLPVIVIMANFQKNKKTSQAASMQLNERNGSGGGSRQKNTKPSQNPWRTPASNSPPPTPPPPLITSVHSHQDPRSRAYPQSNTHQPPLTNLGMGDLYPQDPRNQGYGIQSQSPDLSTGGIVYAELEIDNNPKSRKPVQLMQTEQTNYASIGMA